LFSAGPFLLDDYVAGLEDRVRHGNTAFQGFDERLKKELIAVLPAGSNITVRKAGHASS
jgi:hypothetical protein